MNKTWNEIYRFEAGHRGVPVLCIPFFLDQFTHCKTLTNRLEMGVLVEPEKINKETFSEALSEVLSNHKYAENAKKVQYILEDQPMKSRDQFLYWVNYTIRHKGAHHLIADAPFELNVLQYWSVDVVTFLLGIPLILVNFLFVLLKSFCGKRESIKLKEKKLK